jgi:integrase/recombinase XerC
MNQQASDLSLPLRLNQAELRKRSDDFLREYLKNKSRETVGTYQRSLKAFERWVVEQEEGFRFTSEGVQAYKTYLSETRGLQEVSISTYLTALRRFCEYLVHIGLLNENPALGVKGNRRPRSHSRQLLSEAEVASLLQGLDVARPIDKRDRAIVYLMLFAGLSEIEIVRADVRDLEHMLMGWFLRVQGKGRKAKDQQVPVEKAVMDAIRLYLDTRRIRPEAPLFVSHGHRSAGERLNTRSVRSRINRHLAAAGIKRAGVSPHSLTHTAAVLWIRDGMSLEEVRQRMRHGTLDTTMLYAGRQSLPASDSEKRGEPGA